MNYWTQLSIDYANQRCYLDDLHQVYGIENAGRRDINENEWEKIVLYYNDENKTDLLKNLLKFERFPFQDPFIGYLRKDPSSIERNPYTFNRICEQLYELDLSGIYNGCTEPKEKNRQLGQMFRNWVKRGAIGIEPIDLDEFLDSENNAILNGDDNALKDFAEDYLNYSNDKGLDFVGRFNGKYVIGEAKFLTDHGGNQRNNIDAAIRVLNDSANAIKIAILDGVVYIRGKNYQHRQLYLDDRFNIMSSLVLREFLYQI